MKPHDTSGLHTLTRSGHSPVESTDHAAYTISLVSLGIQDDPQQCGQDAKCRLETCHLKLTSLALSSASVLHITVRASCLNFFCR